MIYRIICVGNIKEQSIRNMLAGMENEINRKEKLVICQVEDEKIPKNASHSICERIKKTEGSRLLKKIEKGDYVAALCINGRRLSSEQLKRLVIDLKDREIRAISFVIGGSLGLSDEVIKRADILISFSEMTFPHQLMRLILADQIRLICDK